jgi:hypothetical protein
MLKTEPTGYSTGPETQEKNGVFAPYESILILPPESAPPGAATLAGSSVHGQFETVSQADTAAPRGDNKMPPIRVPRNFLRKASARA